MIITYIISTIAVIISIIDFINVARYNKKNIELSKSSFAFSNKLDCFCDVMTFYFDDIQTNLQNSEYVNRYTHLIYKIKFICTDKNRQEIINIMQTLLELRMNEKYDSEFDTLTKELFDLFCDELNLNRSSNTKHN